MFEQAFKNIDDILRKEAGCTTDLGNTNAVQTLRHAETDDIKSL